jgi:hypothetical protein
LEGLSKALASPSAFFIDSISILELEQLTGLSHEQNPEFVYFVNLDLSDCNSCVRSTYFLSSLVNEDSEIYVLLEANELRKEKLLRSEFNLPESAHCIDRASVPKLYQSFRKRSESQKSWITKLKGSKATVLALKEFGGMPSFAITPTEHKSPVVFDDTSFFYKGFSHLIPVDEQFVALEYPGSNVLLFADNGKYLSDMTLDSAVFKQCFEAILTHYHDSIRDMNDFMTSIDLHKKSMEPMGFSLLSVHNIQVSEQGLKAIGLLSIPIQSGPSDYEVAGRYFLFDLDVLKGRIIASNFKPMRTSSSNGYWPMASNYFEYDTQVLTGLNRESSDSQPAPDTLWLTKSYSWHEGFYESNTASFRNYMTLDLSDKFCLESRGNLLSVIRPVYSKQGAKKSHFLRYYPMVAIESSQFQKIDLHIKLACNDFTNYFTIQDGDLFQSVVMIEGDYFIMPFNGLDPRVKKLIPIDLGYEILLGMQAYGDTLNYWCLNSKRSIVLHSLRLDDFFAER